MTTATLERRKKTSFPAGKKRYVCVNRLAIVANLQEKKNYPTVIVVEDGVKHEFHDCDVDGHLQFDDTRNDLPAKVFIETEKEIVAFVDTEAEPTHLNLPPKPRFSLTRWVLDRLEYVPVVGCVVSMTRSETPPVEPPKPKPTPQYERASYGCGS